MNPSIELATLDLRYEGYRMRSASAEARLLSVIAERGIEQPLEGVQAGDRRILLNGFKRYRCARTLGITVVPYASLGEDEAAAIVRLLRASNDHALAILEQARFIDDLKNLYRLSLAEIAATLSRSKGWVSMRLGLLGELTPNVRAALFSGTFPVYAYLYSVRPFMRMNGTNKGDIDAFVAAVSRKRLSVRQIDRLARGYFRGPSSFRAQVHAGHLAVLLEGPDSGRAGADDCTVPERNLINDLEIVGKTMLRVTDRGTDDGRSSPAFLAQANLLTAGIIERLDTFTRTVREIHDRSGQA